MTDDSANPRTEFLPRILNTPSRLVCYNGWSDETTSSFGSHDFEQLELRGTRDQQFEIPSLGDKAGKLERLSLKAAGNVEGLKQFSAVSNLGVSTRPRNGLDLGMFGDVRRFFFEWDKSIAAQLVLLEKIESLGCIGYRFDTLAELKPLATLREIAVTQGTLISLDGVEGFTKLKSIELAHLRKLESIDALYNVPGIESLRFTRLPKVSDNLRLRQWSSLSHVYVVDSPLSIDCEGVGTLDSLEMIWTNGPVSNLQWPELLMLKSLKKVGVVDPEMNEAAIRATLGVLGRDIASLKLVGPRKSKQIQLNIA